MVPLRISQMQRIQNNVDYLLYRIYKPWRGPKSEAVHAVAKQVFKL